MSLEAKSYGDFLKKQRQQRNVEREALGEGIFQSNMLGKIERGERYPNKLIRDRLLARLGESGYDYECFLQSDEYEEWEERRDIIDSLDNHELDRADGLLVQYERKHGRKNKISLQFLLTMRVQWMELKAVSREERSRILEEAVKLTIPEIDTKPVAKLVLSVQELNLMLEYEAYRHPDNMQFLCLQLLQYLEEGNFDLESKAILGAKIALYYCKEEILAEENSRGILEKLQKIEQKLDICIDGIEKLRDHQKLYFAWDLLQRKEQYLSWLLKNRVLFSEEKGKKYEMELEQTREFYRVIDDLYERYQIPKKTNVFTCFYREHEIYCLNEVIRARRRMLGVTAEELEEKLICGKSTLKRLEANKTTVQMAIVQNLFSYLNLSPEMHRAQIITENQEAVRLEEQYRWLQNQKDYAQAEVLLQRLKAIIPMAENINRQYIHYDEKLFAYRKGELNKEQFIQHAVTILEYTIPLEAVMEKIKDKKHSNGRVWTGEKYLTNMEVTILKNIANEYGNDTKNVYWEILKEYFEWLEKKCTLAPILGMYGFVMTSVASWLGNIGKFEESNALNKKILRETLRTRSLGYVHRNMYGLLWNDRKQKGLPMEKDDPEWRRGLLDCFTIDKYCKDELRAKNIKKRLEMQ